MKRMLFFVTSLLLTHGAMAADSHSHDHHKSAPAKLNLENGKKWATDAALRNGMDDIKKLMEAQVPSIHNNTLSKEKYVALSNEVSTATSNIFKNCKLKPEADAMLHIILAQILDGMKAMKSADKIAAQRDGAVKIISALDQYPRYFAHEGWKPLKH